MTGVKQTGVPWARSVILSASLVSAGGEKAIAEAISKVIQKRLGGSYEVIVKEIPRATQFLEAAKTEQADLFVIVLNNIIPDAQELFPGTSKPDQALRIITYLKERYRKPVVALAGWWPEGMNIHEEAHRAGADYFSELPADSDFFAAVLRCLGLAVKDSPS